MLSRPSSSRLLNLVPFATAKKHTSRLNWAGPSEELLRVWNNSASSSLEAILKEIQAESLMELIKVREQSMKLSLKNVDSSAYSLLRDTFAFEKLNVKRVSWQNSAAQVVEFVGLNDRVRKPSNWRQLKLRLDTETNLRCYGVFHERLSFPVSFVYIKLYGGARLISNISNIIRSSDDSSDQLDSCVFYSISSPFMGLNGIEFGAKLIKKVSKEIQEEYPQMRLLATFSPIPKFITWLSDPSNGLVHLSALSVTDEIFEKRNELLDACWRYLNSSSTIDPVARFHYRNGAKLGQVNFAADPSPTSISQSYGIQANYVYLDSRH
jgi:malonyl-CoA decarboxylase